METQPRRRRAGRHSSKVKSGCLTCKARKVKCDEKRPACSRCVSTGRVCEGYGVWDRGGQQQQQQQQQHPIQLPQTKPAGDVSRQLVPSRPVRATAATYNPEEIEVFDWFKRGASKKLAGMYISNFWTTLVLQASISDPTIWNAMLALSSVYKQGVLQGTGTTSSELTKRAQDIRDRNESFVVGHYTKALTGLRLQLKHPTRASLRVSLTTCIIFTALDILRGHLCTAELHLQNGLQILHDAYLVKGNAPGMPQLKPSNEHTDDWLVEAFSRFYLQFRLLRRTSGNLSFLERLIGHETDDVPFESLNAAWRHLTWIFNKIFDLNDRAWQQTLRQEPTEHSTSQRLLDDQHKIHLALEQWNRRYDTFVAAQTNKGFDYRRAFQILPTYHSMAYIMADTCIQPDNEMNFDAHTGRFSSLVEVLADVWALTSSTKPMAMTAAHQVNIARSIMDLGWIPPLFYTATKCRVHSIRSRAIHLLESTSHREGPWDSKSAACVARKVMALEENGTPAPFAELDPFPCAMLGEDLSLEPRVVEQNRICDMEMELLGTPVNRILLLGKHKINDDYIRIPLAEYDTLGQCWINCQ